MADTAFTFDDSSTPEATTTALHKAALAEPGRATVIADAFSGRPARGVANRFTREQGPINPAHPASPLATPALAREAFFSPDFPEQDLRKYWALMQDESYRAFLDMIVLDLPRPAKVQTPMLVLGAARDNMVSPRDIGATARAYRAEADIVPGVAHDSMLERRWKNTAERIRAWLDERRF